MTCITRIQAAGATLVTVETEATSEGVVLGATRAFAAVADLTGRVTLRSDVAALGWAVGVHVASEDGKAKVLSEIGAAYAEFLG